MDFMQQRTTHSLKETQEAAQEFLHTLESESVGNGALVVGLYGDLGSGKTSFTQGLAKALGIEMPVLSPTFVIEKRYDTLHSRFKKLVHIDAYRFESPDELLKLRWGETLGALENLVLIEWPERVASVLPDTMKKIKFTFIDEHTRTIEFNA